jgi:hypothetical protein
MADGFETKRAKAPEDDVFEPVICTPEDLAALEAAARPSGPPPARDAPLEERVGWSSSFVKWAWRSEVLNDPIGTPLGHRWRTEFGSCVEDPQEYERIVLKELGLAE